MKWDITQRMKAVDEYAKKLTNPRHRAIIQNYRRHAILEVSGQWQGILVPEMTVEEPTYRFHSAKGLEILDGMAKVQAMYASLVDEGSTVIYHTDEHVAVADWGFSTEYKSHRFWKGALLQALGDKIDDPEATYLVSMTQVMVWLHDDKARMMEERVYRGADRTVRKCDPSEVITVDECREKLMPLIPEQDECSLLNVR